MSSFELKTRDSLSPNAGGARLYLAPFFLTKSDSDHGYAASMIYFFKKL